MKPQKTKTGIRFVQIPINGKRVRIIFGRITLRESEKIAGHLESIIGFNKLGIEYPPEIQGWLNSVSPEFRKMLAERGVIDLRSVITFAQLFRKFMASYKDGTRADSTLDRMNRSVQTAIQVFGRTVCDEITAEQVLEYEKELKSSLAETTWTKSLSDTKQVFDWGIKKAKLIRNNPIKELKGGRKSNPERMIYVDRASFGDILDIATGDWKMIFALARYAGLRIPSELARLRWDSVDFSKSILKVYGKKTKRPRLMPIFDPLEGIINQAWEALPVGTPKRQHLIEAKHRRESTSNLRTTALKLIDRAGVDVWVKLFQNLRMSCATDLLNAGYPVTKVADWLGHSVNILITHYKGFTGREIAEAREVNNDPFFAKSI